MARFLQIVKRLKFIIELVSLDIGQKHWYLWNCSIFLFDFHKVISYEVEPEYFFFCYLCFLAPKFEIGDFLSDLKTHTRLGSLFTLRNMVVEYTLKVNKISGLVKIVNTFYALEVIKE